MVGSKQPSQQCGTFEIVGSNSFSDKGEGSQHGTCYVCAYASYVDIAQNISKCRFFSRSMVEGQVNEPWSEKQKHR